MTPAERSRLEALVERWLYLAQHPADEPMRDYAHGYYQAEIDTYTGCAGDLAAILAEPDMTGVLANELSVARFEMERLRAALMRVDAINDSPAHYNSEINAVVQAALLNASRAPVNARKPEPIPGHSCGDCPGDGRPCRCAPGNAPPPLDPAVVAELERLRTWKLDVTEAVVREIVHVFANFPGDYERSIRAGRDAVLLMDEAASTPSPVPVTEAMVEAAMDAFITTTDDPLADFIRSIITAALAAAPPDPLWEAVRDQADACEAYANSGDNTAYMRGATAAYGLIRDRLRAILETGRG